jgi:adenylylsulfate kinase-like enzyme
MHLLMQRLGFSPRIKKKMQAAAAADSTVRCGSSKCPTALAARRTERRQARTQLREEKLHLVSIRTELLADGFLGLLFQRAID